jgi:hypothetical protein
MLVIDAVAAVLRFVTTRWGQDLPAGSFGAEVRKVARARGLSCPLDQHMEAAARRHDMLAVAFRLAARAARGEALEPLVNAPLEPPR